MRRLPHTHEGQRPVKTTGLQALTAILNAALAACEEIMSARSSPPSWTSTAAGSTASSTDTSALNGSGWTRRHEHGQVGGSVVTNPWVKRLRDLEPYSVAWLKARDELFANDRPAYRRWLDDNWRTDQAC